MNIPWTSEEDALIRKLWPTQGSSCASSFPNRTLAAVRNRAKTLKVTRVGLLWTEEEDNIIRTYYSSEGKDIVQRLPGRTIETIYGRAQNLGVSREIPPEVFTSEEQTIVQMWYHKDKEEMYRLLPGHTKEGCKREARSLGLLKEQDSVPWTTEEEQYLRDHYPTEGTSCFDYFSGRTYSSINGKVRKLGLLIDEEHQALNILNRTEWTAKQDALLRAYYPVEGSDCYVRIEGHTATACKCRAKKLGILYDRDSHVLPTGEIKVRQNSTAKEILKPGMIKGRLKLMAPAPYRTDDGKILWQCECSCGNKVTVRGSNLRSGKTRSCGCIAKEIRRRRITKIHKLPKTKYRIKQAAKELPYRVGMLDGTNASSHLSGYVRKDNPTGVRGVGKTKNGRFSAQIKFKKKCYRLGVFDTLEEAAQARKRAEENLTPELLKIMAKAGEELKRMRGNAEDVTGIESLEES